jgi:hypothetical protein
VSRFDEVMRARAKPADPEPPDPSPAPPSAPPPPRRGRPKGKRSSGDHEQVTAYLRRETYRNVKVALIKGGGAEDFSELVERLLSGWLESRS